MSTSAAIQHQERLGPSQKAGRTRFSLSTNFDDALPSLVAPFGVFELYGKLPADAVGGGRAGVCASPDMIAGRGW